MNKLLAVLLMACAAMGTAWASDSQSIARKLQASGDILPLRVLLETVQKQVTGHILELELEMRDDRLIYEMEVLDERGWIWEYHLDARTGQVIKASRED